MIEKRDGSYYVRDLRSSLGTIVNGEPIGDQFRGDDAPLRAGENEVIAGGVGSLRDLAPLHHFFQNIKASRPVCASAACWRMPVMG
jgi:FHA domain-containing protein